MRVGGFSPKGNKKRAHWLLPFPFHSNDRLKKKGPMRAMAGWLAPSRYQQLTLATWILTAGIRQFFFSFSLSCPEESLLCFVYLMHLLTHPSYCKISHDDACYQESVCCTGICIGIIIIKIARNHYDCSIFEQDETNKSLLCVSMWGWPRGSERGKKAGISASLPQRGSQRGNMFTLPWSADV